MFLQICLVTAGLHFGRKLWKDFTKQPTEPVDGADLRSEPDARQTSRGELALLVSPAPPSGLETSTSVPPEDAHDEAEAVQEQFETAIFAAGLTTAAALFFPGLRLLGGVSVMYGSIPIFEKAKHLLVDERRLGIEVLDSVGLIASVAARQYTISAVMSLFYAGAEKLRLEAESEARESMLDVFSRQPDEVWAWKDGVEVSVPLKSLRAGDIVVVGAGASIPADGVVTEGTALVDEHVLTGESALAERTLGDRVFALTIVSAGKLHVQMETAGKGTAAAQISQILQNTADFASTIEVESKRLADASVVPILALSALAYPVAGVQGTTAMLNIGIADNLRIVAPFSVRRSLRKAYDAGILLKDGRSLQFLPNVDTVVFDKTGTLTGGELGVWKVYPAVAVDEEEVLAYAAAVEHRQTHPIARAITSEAERRGYAIASAKKVSLEIGFGIAGKVGGRTVRVGSKRFMMAHALDLPEALIGVEQAAYHQGSPLVYVARGRAVIGLVELTPTVRPEALKVIRSLKERGLSLYLLSGDHEAPTRAMAERMGFDRYYSGVLSLDKARIIDELQEQGKKICFVGDGINDAVALKRSTVSVSMRGASTVALDSAQIVLMEGGIGKLPELFTIATDLQTNLRGILLTAVIPTVAAASGILVAGFTTNAVAGLYAASLASGMAVAMWPHREKPLHDSMPEDEPEGGKDGHTGIHPRRASGMWTDGDEG